MGQAAVDNFMRFYLVPGLAHGGGNFSPMWGNLAILDNWVERGITPPAAPVAFDDTKSATRGRSRPMCVYPTWARYNGGGDVNLAANYRCVK
jgi:feruloyl esterase